MTTNSRESELESWVEWLKRTTTEAEQHLAKNQIDDWITAWRRRVWRWASRVACLSVERWAYKALNWHPEDQ
eukprot:644076-Karenia_brevis.AAC.1